MTIRNKLSHDQLKKATQSRHSLKGGSVRLLVFEAGEETEVQSWEWEDTRDATWPESVEDTVRNYSEAQGPGVYKYVVRTYDKGETQRANTWLRWVVKREAKDANATADELDGSVQAFVVHLQRAYEDERKARNDAIKMMMDGNAQVLRLLGAMAERQVHLEQEHKSIRDAEREQLRTATKALEELADKERETEEGGPFAGMLSEVAGKLAERAMDRFGPELEPLVKSFVKSMVVDEEGIAEAAKGELHS